MRTKALIGTLVLFLGIVFYSCKPSDQKLQTEVNAVLANKPGITAVVKEGVVTLTGTVEAKDAKDEAEALCKNVKNIKSVANNIEVKEPAPVVVVNPDDSLKAIIGTALTDSGFGDVVVDIKDGEVTLSGTIKKADLKKVMQIANESKPKKVINKLTLK